MKKLYINVPFLDALQVPTYAKYVKDIMQSKKCLVYEEVVKLTQECTAAINDVTPEKKPDPGSPSIRCLIGSHIFERALCDLGASVSVIPRYVYENLNLPKLEPTANSLELADHTIRYPNGVAEDVSVQIGDHIVPDDFIVLDMDKRTKTPLILGRPFLRTARANIDVGSGKISFDISGASYLFKFRPKGEECRMVSMVDKYRAIYEEGKEDDWRKSKERM